MALRFPDGSYKLGRGRFYLAPFAADAGGVLKPTGKYRYVGNTPEASLALETESLEHTSSEEGINQVDATVQLSVNRTLTLVTDHIDLNNLAMFFLGEHAKVSIVAAHSQKQTFPTVSHGEIVQVGVTDANPLGFRNLRGAAENAAAGTKPTLAVVVNPDDRSADVDLVEGTDYETDLENGIIQFLEGGNAAIDGAKGVEIEYGYPAQSYERVISKGASVEGSLRYVENNPRGRNDTLVMPRVAFSPNGDFALKAQEWMQIPMTGRVLKPANSEALYINGAAVVA